MLKNTHILFRASGIYVCLLGMALWPSFSFSADAEKPKIVSLDYCSDQFVLYLADKEQILA
ncbi:MAG: hypothetical protein P8I94_00790, partial [Emcibacteraceae bacterium]|nr:hypothetical protein [Emcibacteraceae bacterium]